MPSSWLIASDCPAAFYYCIHLSCCCPSRRRSCGWNGGTACPRLHGGFLSRLGLPLVFIGVGLASWSAIFFVTRGQGTPDPNNPPRVFLQDGPYGCSRNPMAAGGVLTLLGVGLLARSLLLLLYVATLAPVLQLYHIRTEEPDLVERFGEAYLDYRRRVPRWLPRARRAVATGATVPE